MGRPGRPDTVLLAFRNQKPHPSGSVSCAEIYLWACSGVGDREEKRPVGMR